MKTLVISLFVFFLALTAISCHKETTGCHNPKATNYEPNTDNSCKDCCDIPKEKGSLLIWTNLEDMFGWGFGSFYINIDNEGLKLLNKYYITPPNSCVNLIGGYYSLEEGEHICQIYGFDGTTLLQEGLVTVQGGQCNLRQLHPIGASGLTWLKSL